MNIVYGYITTKVLESSIYYGFRICKNMAYDFIFNNNKNNEVLVTDPVWSKELQKKVFKRVLIDNEEKEEEEEVVEIAVEIVSKDETDKEEKKTKEIEIQTGESLYKPS